MRNPDLQRLTREMYDEVDALMADPEMASVTKHGLSPLYGPLTVNPDVAIITFQGGGDDNRVQTRPPERLLYVDDDHKFGRTLRKYMQEAGLHETLVKRTVAHATVFPQAPTQDAASWVRSTPGLKAEWRKFSKRWAERLLEAQSSKVLLFFGEKVSRMIGVQWTAQERNTKQNHLTFARSEWRGMPAIYCHHLSIGCPRTEAIRCMREVKSLI